MKRYFSIGAIVLLFMFLVAPVFAQEKWQGVKSVFGSTGESKGDYIRINFDRKDTKKIMKSDEVINSGMILETWIGFTPAKKMKMTMGTGMEKNKMCKMTKGSVMMMGEIALLESEAPAVIKKLIDQNIHISAIHNHHFLTNPSFMFIHICAMGEETDLAKKVKSVLELTAISTEPTPPESTSNKAITGPLGQIHKIFGISYKNHDGILEFEFPGKHKVTMMGMDMPALFENSADIHVQQIGDKIAAIGEVALTADEVEPVVSSLEKNGFSVEAVHNHMIMEMPRIFYIHFWGMDTPDKIGNGIKQAINRYYNI